ncbi:CEREBLON [Salix viminalis]|uniref:CEREBLON n=1 Tax=Salix viminalis TaxID=40686 RepID=A0A9Q0NQI1_SALVM|nr:CEREBLON [Salix viminalis]
MAALGAKFLSLRPAAILFFIFMLASVFTSAERSINHEASRLSEAEELEPNYLVKIISFLWQSDESGYQHVWPVTRTSVKAFFKGLDTWQTETILKQDATKLFESTAGGSEEVEYKPLPDRQVNDPPKVNKVNILQNIYWKELGLLVFVWVTYLAVQIAKNYTAPCSTTFWVLNLLQIPVSIGVFLYEAIGLYEGRRRISSKGDEIMDWQVHRLLMFCACGVVAGIVGGLLGIGGGFVMGPLFLEMGIHPQVSSGTATFGMLFSSSMSVVEYYLLGRFPVPYALYFIAVAIVAAFIGQYIITKLITISGRASLIIFVLAFTIFISAIALGGVGITSTIGKIERHEYMGFENLCRYTA